TELRGARHDLDGVRHELDHKHAELEGVRHELGGVRLELHTVYHSPTWRAGRIAAVVGRPALLALRRRRRPRPSRRPRAAPALAPEQGYVAFTKGGQPWHFPSTPSKAPFRSGASLLEALVNVFGKPQDAVDGVRASKLGEQLDRLRWADDESLVAKRLTWEERQAVVEADAIVSLVKGCSDGNQSSAHLRVRTFQKAVVAIDARCLQEHVYSTRGVGRHARTVLEATRMIAVGHSLVLLTSAELPALTQEVAELADSVVVGPYQLRTADVALFVELSPMTGSCGPTLPFLARRGSATASVVFDFIPTE